MTALTVIDGVEMPMRAEDVATLPVYAPTPRREVSKLLLVERLEVRGLGDVWEQALTSNGPARRRWNACVSLYADDPEVRGFLAALGVDPDAILAPGGTGP